MDPTEALQSEPFTTAIARFGVLTHIIRGKHESPARQYEALCGFSPAPARPGKPMSRDGKWYARGHFDNLADFIHAGPALRDHCSPCLEILRGNKPLPPRKIPLEITRGRS